jgi:CBS domain-containing protein
MAGDDQVGAVMSKTVRTVDSGKSLREALRLMVEYDIGSIVVTHRGRPVGIITERDIVKRLGGRGPEGLDRKTGAIASKPLITIDPEVEVWKAFAKMLRKKIRRLPVMRGGALVGIVTERDLLKWVVKVTYEPNIPDEIKRLIAQNP